MPAQVRAARGLLDWSQAQLAAKAGISVVTVKRVEGTTGRFQGKAETLWRIEEALHKAGVTFLPSEDSGGPGVRLTKVNNKQPLQ